MKIKLSFVPPTNRQELVALGLYALRHLNNVQRLFDEVFARCEAKANAESSAT